MSNPVEIWKASKHGFDVWADVQRYAAAGTAMKDIDQADLERMKWYGFFYRKRDAPGRYMNRIRVTAGELTAAQAKAVAHLAYEFGHGVIDVTTRANLQVQGLDIRHLPKVSERLQRVGLTSKQTGHDNIRNVFGHPFSGLMPGELIDTRQLCHDITAIFLDSREYSDLPRKMNICLNGTPHHSAHFWTQDISFLATRTPQGEAAFHLLIAGTQGQTPHLARRLPVFVRLEQTVEVTRALLDLFRAKGLREKRNAARFCFLVDDIGPEGVLAWLDERLPFRLERSTEQPSPASAYDELIGWFHQREGQLWTMGLNAPLGRLSWRQLEGLAILSAKWGDGRLRTTHEQGIAVVNIPAQFKNAAAIDAAALGLSVHADSFDRNSMACTGSQFCNIAVTETKGHMFQLLEKLRKKKVQLEGIRIHMSGCPSSCAQHFTADIGLKGVRVRRLVGTREGFDVFLGGGIGGQIEMGRPYRLGVDVDQLPNVIEEVVADYYLHHRPGETFSAYWRERLPADEGVKTADGDYRPPIWVCENCQHRHVGIDPPVFCPGCAGLRRFFARLDEESGASPSGPASKAQTHARSDGFVYATEDDALKADAGLEVEVNGKPIALFRVNGQVYAVDAACPHEGAPLAQGTVENGVVTCPWHGWTFNACTGCSLEPANQNLARYEALAEDGKIFIKVETTPKTPAGKPPAVLDKPRHAAPAVAALPLIEVIEETPDVRTFRFDNSAGRITLDYPGKFVSLCVEIEGQENWRNFTVSSSPERGGQLDLTIKLNPEGTVSRHLFAHARRGAEFTLRGPQGGFYFDPERHWEPLLLVSAGSGITPMMSILRSLKDRGLELPCAFAYGARTAADIVFHQECSRLAAASPWLSYHASLSQPEVNWRGACGRLSVDRLQALAGDLAPRQCFLCGPNDFMDSLREGLLLAGVAAERIHAEQFQAAKPARA
ncbi:MAG TPA: Rieske 2Fe-2S domain-containing protein [Pirellulales bacterium]|nr:Rieske 2Fe-2S domain-containing protein [Pirellulales bacterium]